jgi:hypothetical protein
VDDQEIQDQIKTLVERQHALRERASHHEIGYEDEQRQLREVEEELDRSYDLLRRRRALREDAHTDPDGAEERSTSTVEGYLQ